MGSGRAMHVFGLGSDSTLRVPSLKKHCITRDTISIIPMIIINDLNGYAMQIRSSLDPTNPAWDVPIISD
jgi:hypothetical protein